jgi:hypothetical protein
MTQKIVLCIAVGLAFMGILALADPDYASDMAAVIMSKQGAIVFFGLGIPAALITFVLARKQG